MYIEQMLYKLVAYRVVYKFLSYSIQVNTIEHGIVTRYVVEMEGSFGKVVSTDGETCDISIISAIGKVLATLKDEKKAHIDRLKELSSVLELVENEQKGGDSN